MLVQNTIRHLAYSRFKHMDEVKITENDLVLLTDQAKEFLNSNGVNIGKKRVRELLVEYLLDEFGCIAFGTKPLVEKREISEKTIKKYQKARRRGF